MNQIATINTCTSHCNPTYFATNGMCSHHDGSPNPQSMADFEGSYHKCTNCNTTLTTSTIIITSDAISKLGLASIAIAKLCTSPSARRAWTVPVVPALDTLSSLSQ